MRTFRVPAETVVTATYEHPSSAPDDYHVRVTKGTLEYRAFGDKRWTVTPWNQVFATLGAAASSDKALAQLFPKKRK